MILFNNVNDTMYTLPEVIVARARILFEIYDKINMYDPCILLHCKSYFIMLIARVELNGFFVKMLQRCAQTMNLVVI